LRQRYLPPGEGQRCLQNLGNNGDTIDPTVWGQWTSRVENRRATVEEVLDGIREEPTNRKAMCAK
jgi:catalase